MVEPISSAGLIHFVLSLAVCVFAFRWRHFWSVRFLLAAAVLNVFLLYAPWEVFQRANGVGARGTPVWITAPIFTLWPFLSTLVLCLASLALLSFLPGGERRGGRRDNVIVLASVIVIGCLSTFIGFRSAAPPRHREPLNPEKTFYPNRPLSSLVSVQLKPKKVVVPDGSGTQFEVTFTNTSTRDINLTGVPFDGLKFRPYIWVQQMRDGWDLSWGTDLKVPPEHELLHSGESWTFEFPEQPQMSRREKRSYYDEDRQVLKPGDYSAFLAFWLERNGDSERVLSNVADFSVR
jgi:hypothetical protein